MRRSCWVRAQPVYAGACGDNKFKKEDFGLPYWWKSFELCEVCEATQSGAMNFADFRIDAPFVSRLRRTVDVLAAIQAGGGNYPLLRLEGWHCGNNFEDLLHDDLLGPRQHLCGGVLKQLCDESHFGAFAEVTEWMRRLDAQLSVAFTEFCSWCTLKRIGQSQSRFTHLSLSLKSKSSWPILKAKAKNCQVVSEWLLSVCAQVI
jgi:hypothetical protein